MSCQELHEVQQSAVLHLGRNNPRHPYMLRSKQMGNSFEKELGDPGVSKLNMSHKSALGTMNVNGSFEVLPVSRGR